MSKSVITRAVNRFERAVDAKAFEGTIPYHSDGVVEQEDLDAAHEAIRTEYAAARAALIRLLERAL